MKGKTNDKIKMNKKKHINRKIKGKGAQATGRRHV